VNGAGTLAAFGTGKPVTEENYTTGEFTSWLGRFLAVVRSGYEIGEAVLRVSIEGLGSTETGIKIV
jgi:beta-galactosidase